MADLFDQKVEETLKTLAPIAEQLRKVCPHGHPEFVNMALRAIVLHSLKNHDYAAGGPALGNFDRRAGKAAVYKTGKVEGIDLSDSVQLTMWDIEKQLDAAWWMRVRGTKASTEGVSKRMWDVGVYSFIVMCMLEDEEKRKAT